MDDQSFRLGNRLLGNPEGMAGLEMTHTGPTLAFSAPARICLTGADFGATLDGVAVPLGQVVDVAAGQTLATGRTRGGGMRGYLLIAGGLDIAPYLGSRARSSSASSAAMPRGAWWPETCCIWASRPPPIRCPLWPAGDGHGMDLRVLYGPHGAPDFFTDADIAMVVGADWQVHYNSNRTGAPDRPQAAMGARRWWRGRAAPLQHPRQSLRHRRGGFHRRHADHPGPRRSSLGGFVCPFVVIAADRWKIGQLVPGDRLRFVPVSIADAQVADAAQRALVAMARPGPAPGARGRDAFADPGRDCRARYTPAHGLSPAGRSQHPGGIRPDRARYRAAHSRPRLMTELERMALPGVIDVVPGIRSLQVHFDGLGLDQQPMLAALIEAEERLGDLEDFTIPSRIVHLPLSWRDPATIETIEKYMGAVRDDAPWCPDNIEFIRRINGLPDTAAVENLIFEANYLVMGLGDVYLGAPVATPVDPRHRLVTTKYNPARTWTPPNVVGIGGAYMCIYGMEGPGGYQLFGRTIQVWNPPPDRCLHRRQTLAAAVLRPDPLYPVSAEELVEWRRDFPTGRRSIRIEQSEFRLADYRAFWLKTRKALPNSRPAARPPSTRNAPTGNARASSTG
jgi:urea carboxylase